MIINIHSLFRKTCLAVVGASLLPAGGFAADQDRDPYGAGTRSRPADSTTATQQILAPQQFVQHAALAGLKEVRLGQIAVQRAEDSQVRQFAQQMIQDHSEANRKLTQIALTKGFPVPDTNAFARAAADRQYVRDQETSRVGAPTGRDSGDHPAQDRTRPGTAIEGRQPVQSQQSQAQIQQQGLQTIQLLESKSGKEFDQAYMNQMVQDHAGSVQKFQTASESLQDQELKNFATETLPKLREHHQMAQQLAAQIGAVPNQPPYPQQTEPRQTPPPNPDK